MGRRGRVVGGAWQCGDGPHSFLPSLPTQRLPARVPEAPAAAGRRSGPEAAAAAGPAQEGHGGRGHDDGATNRYHKKRMKFNQFVPY